MFNVICYGSVTERQTPKEDAQGNLFFSLPLQEPEIISIVDTENPQFKLPDTHLKPPYKALFSSFTLVFTKKLLTDFMTFRPLGVSYIEVAGFMETLASESLLIVERIINFCDKHEPLNNQQIM